MKKLLFIAIVAMIAFCSCATHFRASGLDVNSAWGRDTMHVNY